MQKTFDLAVIGGGIIGLCVAREAQSRGLSVAIIEKGKTGGSCSLGNAGWITPSHVIPMSAPGVIGKGMKWMLNPESPFYIKPSFSRDLAKWLWHFQKSSTHEHVEQAAPVLSALGIRSRDLYREYAKLPGFDFLHEENGLIYVATTDAGYHECLEEAELVARQGQPVDMLDASDVCELEPTIRDDTRGGVFCPGDAHLHPARFTENLTNYLRENGVTFFEGSTATGWIERGGTLLAVDTDKGSVKASQFVLAGGSWTGKLAGSLGLSLPIQPAKGYSLTVPQSEERTQRSVLLYEAKIAVTPLGDEIRYAGTLELAGFGLGINERRVTAIKKAVPKYMTNFDSGANAEVVPWAGLRPCSPDGMPYVGRSSVRNNLLVAAGHAMVGVSLAPVTGELIADVLFENETAIEMYMMHPDRFQ